MCLPERKTLRRGRTPAAWRSAKRVRRWRRAKRALLSDMVLSPLLLLAFLAADLLGRILDALALVGLGRTQAADLRGELSDLLTIRAGDFDFGRLHSLDLDAGRDRDLDVVAVADLHLQHPGIRLGAVADAGDLDVDGAAVRYASEHVARDAVRRCPLHS